MADQSNDHQMEDAQNLAGAADKGKGKAPQVPDAAMESAEDDSSDESGAEADGGEVEPEDEDNMEEIDTSNIVGRRTRGKNIDFTKAAEDVPEDEDEDDDDDFQDNDDAMEE